MNRILEVDEKRAFALVEPGVSYFDLYNHIRERNVKLMLDVPDPGMGQSHGQLPGSRRGLHNVCVSRSLSVALRHGSGDAGGRGNSHRHGRCAQLGYLAGLPLWRRPQRGRPVCAIELGIVTKMGFWLMPMPEAFLSGTRHRAAPPGSGRTGVWVSYLEDLGLTGMPQYGSPVGRSAFGAGAAAMASLMQNGWPSAGAVENFVAAQKFPAWSVQLYFYGPEETVRATWQAAQRRIGKAIAGATFQEGEFLTLPVSKEQEPTQSDKPRLGIPALEVFNMVARNAGNANDPPDGHADLFVTIPRKASALWESARVLFEAYKELGLPAQQIPFPTPFTYYSRCFWTGTTVPTWRDPAKNARSRALFEKVMNRCAEHGWVGYRTNPFFQDLFDQQIFVQQPLPSALPGKTKGRH